MTNDNIYMQYVMKVEVPGGEVFLTSSDALSFTYDCDRLDLAILGVDRVCIDSSGTMPYLAAISDASPMRSYELGRVQRWL